ncbi:TonB-dependent receptor [Parasediminibacterium sp. JCM 36343]|uniref:TonB-dependent receptor n=1 Tax=Parasediminibacterium sp. JCM 36343 TaxID=3374279 RepID=UPI00397D5381
MRTALLLSMGCALLFAGIAIAQKTAKKNTDTLTQKEAFQEVVVSATRTAETRMQSPVSIEKLSLEDIRNSSKPSFFDAIENIKGVQVITPSMGFKVINARGFTNTTNVRFVQMVDGADNQAPHIGAPIANSMGPTDLDMLRVEVIPGSASAMYGMNAINGTANFITKNAFDYQGFGIAQKTGVNHVGDAETGTHIYTETNLRFAKAFTSAIAFKINATYAQGTDWFANNTTDLNPNANASTGIAGGLDNPGKDLVNMYGDESSDRQTKKLGTKQYVISRTGYAEKYVTDYGLKNWKGDISLYFRPAKNIEVSYTYRMANLNNVYQRTNRFRLDNYLTQQHVLNLKSKSIQLKAYATIENTGNSYNIRSMAENINKYFKSDTKWYNDFTTGYNNAISNGKTITSALADARVFADNDRPQPGTPLFVHLIDTLRRINNWDIGAALNVHANMYHAEMQHDLAETLLPQLKQKHKLSLMYGLDYRDYSIVPDGNYFINPADPKSFTDNLNYWKFGGFAQATKLFAKNKLKLNLVLRVDKNQYFAATFNPRLALNYSPTAHHNFRIAVQNGYRFPSIFEAFSNINSGGVKRVGGLPIMSHGIFENSYTNASISSFQAATLKDLNNGVDTPTAIHKNQGLLQKNTYTYLRPEQVSSLEMGYRTKLLDDKLSLDIDFYYNIYKHLMAQIDANVPKTSKLDSIPFYLYNKGQQDKYRLWTNSKTVSYNYGGTFGIAYQLPKKYLVAGNYTLTKLAKKDNEDGLEDGFNSPEWMYNLSVSNPNVYKYIGFSVSFRQQASYLWQSSLATGTVASYSTIDAQVNYRLLHDKANIKIGANNALNKYYYTYIGGASVGGFYYTTLSLEL